MTSEWQDTYTFTARNVDDPKRVVTFTLSGDVLRVNTTGMLRDLEQIYAAEEPADAALEAVRRQATPAWARLAESLSGPIHVNDVSASLQGDRLTIQAWNRTAGLRLTPMILGVGRVDNPVAAEAFLAELERRKAAAAPPGRFRGPLDYWAGWLGLVVLLFGMYRWLRRES